MTRLRLDRNVSTKRRLMLALPIKNHIQLFDADEQALENDEDCCNIVCILFNFQQQTHYYLPVIIILFVLYVLYHISCIKVLC